MAGTRQHDCRGALIARMNAFIHRPVLACVCAVLIVLAGMLALPQLGVERYPSIAPPAVTVNASLPGASARTLDETVVNLIERELMNADNLLYVESWVEGSGDAGVLATFKPGTAPALAQVEVQNRLQAVVPRLPETVRRNGLEVEVASSGFLMLVSLIGSNATHDELDLGDYLARNVVDELRRIEGVGRVQMFGSERAMRVWLDPDRMAAHGLGLDDVSSAIATQNIHVAAGRVGDEPSTPGQTVSYPLVVQGPLATPEEFASVLLSSTPEGGRVRLGDVARVELGAQSYATRTRENGKPAASLSIQLRPGANAVATAERVEQRMDELQRQMPDGMQHEISFNSARFVEKSISRVITTLVEAMVLVFLVMYLFLQRLRYTLVVAVVAPVALLGACSVMLVLGMSINVFTLFGMVLAIGIVVDDAIVVVENIERHVAGGISHRQATINAMREITPAVLGITAVLVVVFVPMAFAGGTVGVIYRQFALAIAAATVFSAALALTLVPALVARIPERGPAAGAQSRGFTAFNRGMSALEAGYVRLVRTSITRPWLTAGAFIAMLGATAVSAITLPTGFLPEEDQGYFMSSIQLPADATAERTLTAVKAHEAHVMSRAGVAGTQSILGFGFNGSGSNTALAYTMLEDWDAREGVTPATEMASVAVAMRSTAEGLTTTMAPAAIDGLGSSSDLAFYLQDRNGAGSTSLHEAREALLHALADEPAVADAYADMLPMGAALKIDVDRELAQGLGIDFEQIGEAISTLTGSSYVGDFVNAGRTQQVIVQADAPARMSIDQLLQARVANVAGGMTALGSFSTVHWVQEPTQLLRYQGFPAIRLSASAAPGYSSGQAIAALSRAAAALPDGFGVELAGESLQEQQAALQAPWILGLSLLVCFLVLCGVYESWSVPIAVLLVVPLALLGCFVAMHLRGLPNDVFFKVGVVTVIGLAAKNAILIVEFARARVAAGWSIADAATEAARRRLRPVLMTSLAFAMGVVPLVLASGAGAEGQHAVGTGVFGGVLTATVLALLFAPAVYAAVASCTASLAGRSLPDARKGAP